MSSPPPCPSRVSKSRLLGAVSSQVLNASEYGGSTNLSGQPMPAFDHLHREKVLFVSSYCKLGPLPLIPSLGTTGKSLTESPLLPNPIGYLHTLVRSSLSLLFSKPNNPSSLGLSSQPCPVFIKENLPEVSRISLHWNTQRKPSFKPQPYERVPPRVTVYLYCSLC